MPTIILETVVVILSLIDELCVYALQSLGAVAHPARRRVVALLIEHELLRRDELAEQLADDEAVPQDDRENVEIALHHYHLPKLDAEMVIEYDRRNGDVILWEDQDTAAEMLDSV